MTRNNESPRCREEMHFQWLATHPLCHPLWMVKITTVRPYKSLLLLIENRSTKVYESITLEQYAGLYTRWVAWLLLLVWALLTRAWFWYELFLQELDFGTSSSYKSTDLGFDIPFDARVQILILVRALLTRVQILILLRALLTRVQILILVWALLTRVRSLILICPFLQEYRSWFWYELFLQEYRSWFCYELFLQEYRS